jgi:hypothetical protein
VPWAKLYRNLAQEYGWTFEQIGEMTMYQALVAAGAWCPEDITFEKAKNG